MNILHVTPSYYPAIRYGGPIYSVHGLCRAQASSGHHVSVLTTNLDGEGVSNVPVGEYVDIDGVQVKYHECSVFRRLFHSPGLKQSLKNEIRDFNIVHLHSVFLWPTWAAAEASRNNGIPYFLSPRGMLDRYLVDQKSSTAKKLWIRFIETKNLEQAAGIHVTSSTERTRLDQFGFNLPFVVEIPNGVDPPENIDKASISDDVEAILTQGSYCLYLGRVHWKKGLENLITQWQDRQGRTLVIAGNDEEGYAAKLRRMVRDQKKGNIILLPRLISGADKEALLQNAELFILPSRSENFANSVLEALIRKTPAVVSEDVGSADVVRESGGGIISAHEHLWEAVSGALDQPERIQKMGEQGEKFVSKNYRWGSISRLMEDAYRLAIEN